MKFKDIDLSKLEGEHSELLQEAGEEIARLESTVTEKDTQLSDAEAKVAELSLKLKESETDNKIDSLVSSGKVTPAQKEETKKLLMSMSEEQVTSYVSLMEKTEPTVDFSESGEEEVKPEEEGKAKVFNVDEKDAEEINLFVEALAEAEKMDFQEALDLVYDKKVDENGKIIKEAE